MSNLIIDIGNSSLKAAFAQGAVLGPILRYEGEDVLEYIRKLTIDNRPSVMIISTVRLFDAEFYKNLKGECDKLLVLDGNTKLPIKNSYRTPETLGPDRLAAVTAAAELFPGKKCIVFDFGTALTIDFLSENGEFYGGNISLGLRTRFKALNHYTQRLPLLESPAEVNQTGATTREAVESGVVLGLIFEVEGYMTRFPDHNFIFTGGDAIYFAKKMKSSIFVVYNLVMMGLARIADYHAR